jgi:hypothetical protein
VLAAAAGSAPPEEAAGSHMLVSTACHTVQQLEADTTGATQHVMCLHVHG